MEGRKLLVPEPISPDINIKIVNAINNGFLLKNPHDKINNNVKSRQICHIPNDNDDK